MYWIKIENVWCEVKGGIQWVYVFVIQDVLTWFLATIPFLFLGKVHLPIPWGTSGAIGQSTIWPKWWAIIVLFLLETVIGPRSGHMTKQANQSPSLRLLWELWEKLLFCWCFHTEYSRTGVTLPTFTTKLKENIYWKRELELLRKRSRGKRERERKRERNIKR